MTTKPLLGEVYEGYSPADTDTFIVKHFTGKHGQAPAHIHRQKVIPLAGPVPGKAEPILTPEIIELVGISIPEPEIITVATPAGNQLAWAELIPPIATLTDGVAVTQPVLF